MAHPLLKIHRTSATGARSSGYDLILVGSSFASSFFLLEVLKHARPDFRILVLERGPRYSHKALLNSPGKLTEEPPVQQVGRVQKPWVTNTLFGGCSNCWWACTPRFHPEDFELATRYGVGVDWPLSYAELEPFYIEAEVIMSVSGKPFGPLWRSGPFPQPPHRFNEPDRVLASAFPDHYTVQPCARTRRRTENRRQCCASGTCDRCPRDAKFTISNELSHLFDDPRVELVLGAEVDRVETSGNTATGVAFRTIGSGEQRAAGDFVALGANALFNPAILLRSSLDGPWTGAGLHEQTSAAIEIRLAGLDNLQGSTAITGHGYMLYSRPERSQRASALIEHYNTIRLRRERGRHRQLMWLKAIYEDLPQRGNRVEVNQKGELQVRYNGTSTYCQKGVEHLEADLQPFLAALPVESYSIDPDHQDTEAHILGTTRMSSDPADGVVDADLLHHRVRNLAVLGSGAFPTSSPANPTLTLSALSLRSARRLYGAQEAAAGAS